MTEAAAAGTARITVCVPTIGRMEFLPRTLDSLLAQTLTAYEVIILDNESGPEAQAFVKQWAGERKNVRVIRTAPRVPMFENFSIGIRAATTEYVTFFHDDDEYMPDFLEKLVALLDAHPSAGFAGSNYEFIDENGAVTETRRWVDKDTILGRREYVSALIGRGRNLIPMPGLVYRRSIMGNGFDTSLPANCGDYVILMQYAEAADVAVLGDIAMRLRRHSAQASHIGLSSGISLRTELFMEYLDGYEKRHPEDRDMVKQLRRRVMLTHRIGLLWGWTTAAKDDECLACIDALPDTALDHLLSLTLRGVTRVGLRPHALAKRSWTVARLAADRLGF